MRGVGSSWLRPPRKERWWVRPLPAPFSAWNTVDLADGWKSFMSSLHGEGSRLDHNWYRKSFALPQVVAGARWILKLRLITGMSLRFISDMVSSRTPARGFIASYCNYEHARSRRLSPSEGSSCWITTLGYGKDKQKKG